MWPRAATRVAPALLISAVLVASYFAAPARVHLTSLACAYTSPTPTITNVSPPQGTTAGGTTVTITGTAFCNGAVTVRFGIKPAASAVVDSNTQITAITPPYPVDLTVGLETVDVTVTDDGGTSAISAADHFTFILPTLDCASAALSSDKPSPQATGTVITFTASSTNCASPEFRFYVQAPGGPWVLARAYGGPTFVWNTAGRVPGAYKVDVWVRRVGSGAAYQAFALMNFTLDAAAPCTAAGLSEDKPSPQQVGTVITFTGTSAGCSQPRYQYYLKSPAGQWSLARSYGAATFAWNSAGRVAGAYTIDVWVRQNGSTSALQTYAVTSFTLVVAQACASAGIDSDVASPQSAGAVVTVTGMSTTCSQPQYLFYLKPPGGPWKLVRGYGGADFVWTTAGLPAGTYAIDVWVRQNGSSSSYQTFALTTFDLT